MPNFPEQSSRLGCIPQMWTCGICIWADVYSLLPVRSPNQRRQNTERFFSASQLSHIMHFLKIIEIFQEFVKSA